MIGVDTNVLVRLLLPDDDPAQSKAARTLFESNFVWIAKTVLLETSWVLTRIYGVEEGLVSDQFTALLGLETVHVEDPIAVGAALALVEHGLEFSDALHLTSRPAGTEFASFDKTFVSRAIRAGVAGVRRLKGH